MATKGAALMHQTTEEKRVEQRKPADAPVGILTEGYGGGGWLTDVSLAGARIELEGPAPDVKELVLFCQLPYGRIFRVAGRVVWSRESSVGLCFDGETRLRDCLAA